MAPTRPPSKALADNDGGIYFDYWLADRLKMTVGQLHQMPNSEFMHWYVFHGLRAQRRQLNAQRQG